MSSVTTTQDPDRPSESVAQRMGSAFNINFIRTYIGGAPLTEPLGHRRERSGMMPRSSPSSSTPQTLQESPAPQPTHLKSLPEQDSRNGDPVCRDEPQNTVMTTKNDDFFRQRAEYYYARYKHYKTEFNTCHDQYTELKAALKDKEYQLEQEARRHEKEARRREREVAELMDELKRLRERESRRKDELNVAEMQHEETKRLLNTKVEELEGMQAFTRKADQVSVADVIELVKALNAEILQAAAFISDPRYFSSSQDPVSDQDRSEAIKVVEHTLGEDAAQTVRILRELRKELDPEDPTAVQHALQIAMTSYCEMMIGTWTHVRDANEWFTKMYERIRATESQAVAGRWRALTRAQAGPKDPKFTMDHLIYLLVDVLKAVGSQVHADVFRETFQEHLTAIVGNIIRIQTAAGELVTSVDVMPYSCRPGMEFRMDYMDDMYKSDVTEDTSKDVILGTTELGLWQKTNAAGELADQPTPLLKAKVVLESAFRE